MCYLLRPISVMKFSCKLFSILLGKYIHDTLFCQKLTVAAYEMLLCFSYDYYKVKLNALNNNKEL